jgi:class 3 adenylate cyclase
MAAKRYVAALRRTLRAPRDFAWALVADTNRWNRASGLAPGRYEWKLVDGRRQYVGSAKELGQTLVWYEPPYEWSEGHFIEGERRFLHGPATAGGLAVTLTDGDAGTTLVDAVSWFAGDGALLALLGPLIRRRNLAALGRYLDAIEASLARGLMEDGRAPLDAEPAVVRARRSLLAGYDVIVSGVRTASDPVELRRRADRLAREGSVDQALVERLVTLLADRPDEELAQIRPFELARAWNADKREVLRLFLHGTRAGLVDLRWQVNCPVCRVSATVADGLVGVGREVHCDACDVSYGVDFGRHVEAVFQSNPAVRRTQPAVYCASSPAFRPHVLAQLRVPAGEERIVPAGLPLGALHVRALGLSPTTDVELDAPPATLRIVLGADAIRVSAEGHAGPHGLTQVVLSNTLAAPATVLVERAGWSADAVLGSVVATFPDFLDLFATEAPATGVELAISNLAVLFSDLTGSTALYERLGDARAFAIVEAHFREMEKAVAAHGGAVVKTMGDAVMATFASPVDAVRAAIAMVAANDAQHADLGLGVKLGVHAGACLAVRANERLDFFGTTVNLAARLQAQAKAGELVVTEELAAHPGVRALLDGRPRRPFEAALKGIAVLQRLVGVFVAPSPTLATPSAST